MWRISRPLWIGGALLALLLGWFDASVVPASVEQSREFRENLHNAAEKKAHPTKAVALAADLTDNNDPNQRWIINHYNTASDRAFGVSIYERDGQGHDQRYVFAKEGYFDPKANHWVLAQGQEILFDATGHAREVRPFSTEKVFPELKEDPAKMLALQQKPGDLSLDELQGVLDASAKSSNASLDAFAVQRYTILAKPLICLLVVGLAIPFAVAGVRSSPMVGASKAIGLFFAYYVVTGTCTHLGNQHYLPALVAAWLPIAAMLGLSVWLFRRAA